MRILHAFYLLLLASSAGTFAQEKISATKIDAKHLPAGIAYEGKVKSATRWTDANGDNIIIATETGIYQSSKFKHENDGVDAELFAYHFIISDGKPLQTWKVYDFISDCPVDIEANFVGGAPKITDLDNDGIAEIWLIYKTVCHGDVSPANMKVIMYEDNQKHAMRGREKVFEGSDDKGVKHYDGGEYTFDAAFLGASEKFRNFAKKLWTTYMSAGPEGKKL